MAIDEFVIELDALMLIFHAGFRVAGKNAEAVRHKHAEIVDHDRPGIAGFREQPANFLLRGRAAALTRFLDGEGGLGQEPVVLRQHPVDHNAHGGKKFFRIRTDIHQAIALPAQFLGIFRQPL